VTGSLVKLSFDTRFHIDFEWWRANDREWRVYLLNYLSEEDQTQFAAMLNSDELVDWVDPETAEVKQVDGLQHLVITTAAQAEDFLGQGTTLVESIFRTFLKNGNTPLSISEIAVELDRPPVTILKMLSGGRIYRGLRPLQA
jgi:hypothetical protein